MDQRYFADIESVKELFSPAEVNEHLKDGTWELIKIGEVAAGETQLGGTVTQSTKLVYVVGLKRKQPNGAQPVPASAAPVTTATSAAKSKPHCKYCQAEIAWTQRNGKYVPLNTDGSDHRCRK